MNDTNSRSIARPDHAGLFDVAAGQAGYFTTEQAHTRSSPLTNPAGIGICRGSAASHDQVSFPVEDGVDLQFSPERLDVLPEGREVDVGPPFEF